MRPSGRRPDETGSDFKAAATDSATDADALRTPRERYAAGELTDAQFERKLERLLNTESFEDAQKRARERDDEFERPLEYDR